MIYRIHFEPKGAYWCIQFRCYYLYWETVKLSIVGAASPEVSLQPLRFESYLEAEKYIVEQGIDTAYHQVSAKTVLSAMDAGTPTYEVPAGYRLVKA